MGKKLLLLIRDEQGLSSLSKDKFNGFQVILASDNSLVRRKASTIDWISKVIWLETEFTLYDVAEDVKSTVDRINSFFTAITLKRPFGVEPYVLDWMYEAEGGMTTQRIQDSFILINSYLRIIDEHKIDKIVIVRTCEFYFEDKVLLEVARSRGLEAISICQDKIQLLIKPYLYLPYFIVNQFKFLVHVFAKKFGQKQECNVPLSRELAFQLCSDARKHVDNVLGIMIEVKKLDYNPIALCWNSGEASEEIQRKGIKALNLEGFVSVCSLFNSMISSIYLCLKAFICFRTISYKADFAYKNVDLKGMLWPSIRFFILNEFPYRYNLDYSLKRYFRYHQPLAIKLWGAGMIAEGELLIRNIPSGSNPLLMYWFWFFIDYPYHRRLDRIDLFLSAGDSMKRDLVKNGVSSKKIANVGVSRYDDIKIFRQNNTSDDSKSKLGIPMGFSFYILYDLSSSMRGYITYREQHSHIEELLNFIKGQKNTYLIFKPHPSFNSSIIKREILNKIPKNAILLENINSITSYDVLNVCDIFVSKLSSMIIESMLFEKPVVAPLFDKQDKWKIYGDAVEYAYEPEELKDLLGRYSAEPAFRKEWTENQIDRQRTYLKDYFFETKESSSKLSAEAIDRHIRKL